MILPAATTESLLALVSEFLSFHDFTNALNGLEEDKHARRSVSGSRRPVGRESGRIRAELLRHFDEGKRDAFFTSFNQFFPTNDPNAQKLEFWLHVFFAIYPVLPCSSVLVAMPSFSSRTSPSPRVSQAGPSPRVSNAGGALSPSGGRESGGGGPEPLKALKAAVGNRQDVASRMRALKAYLETRGSGLAQMAEFLPYYGLPFVKHPERHPTFEHLFSPSWAADQRLALKQYLEAMPTVDKAPALYAMYESYLGDSVAFADGDEDGDLPIAVSPSMRERERDCANGGSSSVASSPRPAANDRLDAVPEEADAAAGAPTPSPPLLRRSSSGSIKGSTRPPLPRVRSNRSRIPAPPMPRRAPDGQAPYHQTHEITPDRARSLSPPPPMRSAFDVPVIEDVSSLRKSGEVAEAAAAGGGKEEGELPALDPQAIRAAVVKGAEDGGAAAGLAARLLQALRWRLARASQGMERWECLASYIQMDVMGCYLDKPHESLLKVVSASSSLALMEEAARLANTIASDRMGRSHLLHQGAETVAALFAMLKKGAEAATGTAGAAAATDMGAKPRYRPGSGEGAAGVAEGEAGAGASETGGYGAVVGGAAAPEAAADAEPADGMPRPDSAVLRAAACTGVTITAPGLEPADAPPLRVAATADPAGVSLLVQALLVLQKLSLRRQAQSQMLRAGMLPWLVTFLQTTSLPEVAEEQVFAILMNLVLRSAGKAQAAREGVYGPLLRLCEGQLESENEQIRTYVNGILYSVLQRPAVRKAAQQRGLPEKLRAVAATAHEPFGTQIKYILSQLDPGAERFSSQAHGDESDDAAGPEGDAHYDDEDAFADVAKLPEGLVVESGELQGEPLLCSGFLADERQAREQAQNLRSASVTSSANGIGKGTDRPSAVEQVQLMQALMARSTKRRPGSSGSSVAAAAAAARPLTEEGRAPPSRGGSAAGRMSSLALEDAEWQQAGLEGLGPLPQDEALLPVPGTGRRGRQAPSQQGEGEGGEAGAEASSMRGSRQSSVARRLQESIALSMAYTSMDELGVSVQVEGKDEEDKGEAEGGAASAVVAGEASVGGVEGDDPFAAANERAEEQEGGAGPPGAAGEGEGAHAVASEASEAAAVQGGNEDVQAAALRAEESGLPQDEYSAVFQSVEGASGVEGEEELMGLRVVGHEEEGDEEMEAEGGPLEGPGESQGAHEGPERTQDMEEQWQEEVAPEGSLLAQPSEGLEEEQQMQRGREVAEGALLEQPSEGREQQQQQQEGEALEGPLFAQPSEGVEGLQQQEGEASEGSLLAQPSEGEGEKQQVALAGQLAQDEGEERPQQATLEGWQPVVFVPPEAREEGQMGGVDQAEADIEGLQQAREEQQGDAAEGPLAGEGKQQLSGEEAQHEAAAVMQGQPRLGQQESQGQAEEQPEAMFEALPQQDGQEEHQQAAKEASQMGAATEGTHQDEQQQGDEEEQQLEPPEAPRTSFDELQGVAASFQARAVTPEAGELGEGDAAAGAEEDAGTSLEGPGPHGNAQEEEDGEDLAAIAMQYEAAADGERPASPGLLGGSGEAERLPMSPQLADLAGPRGDSFTAMEVPEAEEAGVEEPEAGEVPEEDEVGLPEAPVAEVEENEEGEGRGEVGGPAATDVRGHSPPGSAELPAARPELRSPLENVRTSSQSETGTQAWGGAAARASLGGVGEDGSSAVEQGQTPMHAIHSGDGGLDD